MKKFFNMFLMLRVFGIAALVGLTLGSTPLSTLAAQERGGGSYTSPTFEFSVKWDDSFWEGSELEDSEGVGLNSELSYAMIKGIGNHEDGAEGCLDLSIYSLSSDEEYADDFRKAPRKMQRPATADNAAGELFTYLDIEGDVEVAVYLECRDLQVEDAVLQVVLLVHRTDFEDVIGYWDELLAGITVGDKSDNEDDENSKIGKKSKKGDVAAPTYINESAGFTASIDEEVWSVRKTKTDEGLGDGIEVETEVSFGWITGDPYTGDLETCASDFAEGVGTYETITKMREASSSYDVPATSRDAVGGLYTYTDVTEDPVKMVAYFECRWAAEEDFVVTVLLATPKEFYEDELPLWDQLIDGISVDLIQDETADDDNSSNEKTENNDETEDDDSSKGKSEDKDESKKDDAEEEEPVAVKGTTVAGAKFGFELTYDDSIWTVEDLSDVNNDFLDLSSELAIGSVIAFDMPYDGAQCLQVLAELKQGDGVTDFAAAPNSMERPKTSKTADGELFTYTFDGQNGPLDAVTYIECRSIDGGAATLGVMFVTVQSVYPDALPVFETLLDGISTGTEA